MKFQARRMIFGTYSGIRRRWSAKRMRGLPWIGKVVVQVSAIVATISFEAERLAGLARPRGCFLVLVEFIIDAMERDSAGSLGQGKWLF